MVVRGKDDARLEGLRFVGRHERVGHDNDRVAHMHQMRRCAVDTDATRAALARDDVGLQTRSVRVIYYLHALSGVDIRRLNERLINRD